MRVGATVQRERVSHALTPFPFPSQEDHNRVNKARHPVEQPIFLSRKRIACVLTGCNLNELDRILGNRVSGLFSPSNPHLTLGAVASWQKLTGSQPQREHVPKGKAIPKRKGIPKDHSTLTPSFRTYRSHGFVSKKGFRPAAKLRLSSWPSFKLCFTTWDLGSPKPAVSSGFPQILHTLRSRPAELVAQPPQTSSARMEVSLTCSHRCGVCPF